MARQTGRSLDARTGEIFTVGWQARRWSDHGRESLSRAHDTWPIRRDQAPPESNNDATPSLISTRDKRGLNVEMAAVELANSGL
jgi:hypothetical protein